MHYHTSPSSLGQEPQPPPLTPSATGIQSHLLGLGLACHWQVPAIHLTCLCSLPLASLVTPRALVWLGSVPSTLPGTQQSWPTTLHMPGLAQPLVSSALRQGALGPDPSGP